MSDAVPPLSFVRVPEARAPGYIGPLIPDKRWPLRYFTAFLVVAATVAMRAVLAPSLGTQAPLLPFVLTVFVSAYLGGRGPALLAAVLAPVAATFWFTAWPHDAPPCSWANCNATPGPNGWPCTPRLKARSRHAKARRR
jgi:hypothetical protein